MKKSIYVTGPDGMVGWVAGWSYEQSDRTRVDDVRLSLDHRKAITFFNEVQNDVEALMAIALFIRHHSVVYGECHYFAW